jgi:hypothetical protein
MTKARKIEHWRDALATSKEIRWKRPPIKNIEDGKLDIIITIPLTELFEAQTKRAFGYGMLAMLDFHIQKQMNKKRIEVQDIIDLFNNFGLPEIAKQIAQNTGDA